MEEQNGQKGEKAQKVETKNKKEKNTKKAHIGLEIIVVILIAMLAIFLGNTIRKFYIFNTYMAVTNEYSTKDNYKKIQIQYAGDELNLALMGCKKDDKILMKMYSEDNKTTIAYYDKQTKESIVKFDVGDDKLAIVKQEDTPNVFISSVGFIESFTEMSAWQNFLLALHSKVVSEEYKGKDCYKITVYGDLEQWVDKETGLIVRESGGFFEDNKGNRKRIYNEYVYQFGTVTDEDVAKPDVKGYRIQD